jgi:hypothetical protein
MHTITRTAGIPIVLIFRFLNKLYYRDTPRRLLIIEASIMYIINSTTLFDKSSYAIAVIGI